LCRRAPTLKLWRKRCAPAEAMEVASSAIEIFFYRLQISKGVFKKYLLMRFMLQHAA